MSVPHFSHILAAASFRAKLLVAMMLLVSAITGLAVILVERNTARDAEHDLQHQFQGELAALHEVQEERFAMLAERCRALVRKSRIHAAFEDNALDLLYPSARDELRDVMEGEDEASAESTHALHAKFYRFLDEGGHLIPPGEADEVGRLGADETQLALSTLPEEQQLGYFLGQTSAGAETIYEVIATPIHSAENGDPMAALVLGFKPVALGGKRAGAGFKSGIWTNKSLFLPGVAEPAAKALGAEMANKVAVRDAKVRGPNREDGSSSPAARTAPNNGGAESGLPVQVGGEPYLLFYKLLNPGSQFPAAYEVCLYPLADSLARQRHLRWQIIGAGVALLFGGLAASHFVSGRLSAPVEKLEVFSAQNVVQRERAEAALEVTNEELRGRNAELQKALADLKAAQERVIQQERLRALGQMASGIAHDFNNALVPILGFCELLLLSPGILADRKKSLRYLETIQTAAKDAASVVGRLREFYRANDENEKFASVDLVRLVKQVVQLTQPKWKDQAQAAGATIQVATELEPLPPVAGEESALREMLTNLVFNAVDAMPAGGTITIRTRLNDGRAVLEIADTGTGMTDDVRRRCLEPFFSTKGERGTGLGLSMVFGIVQRHAGAIDVQSRLGCGTTFIVTFPPHQDSAPAETVAEAPASRPLRVLLVDDEAPVREVLTAALTEDGHHVEAADQGIDGLRRFMAGKFDLVVTDKAMPGMSGDQMAAAIKQVAPRMPIILLTGFGQFLDQEKIPHVDVLASKPIGLSGLRDAIARAIALA